VYYLVDDSPYPSDPQEKRGYFVGIAEHIGHAMTFKVLSDDTRKIIYRSNIRSASDPKTRNLRLDPLNDEKATPIILSRHDSPAHGEDGSLAMPTINPRNLIGRTFLLPEQEDGQRFRARIVQAIDDFDADLGMQPERVRFLCTANDGQHEEILSYSELMDSLESMEDGEGNIWKFRRITGHQGPLTKNDKDYNGSLYNVMIEWENGEITSEPLSTIGKDDPVTCAIYARENNLLELEGWRRFKSIAQREQKFKRLVHQAKLRSYHLAPKYKYGYQVPHDYNHAMELDTRNWNKLWQEATGLELSQLNEYNTFKDLGHQAQAPSGYKKIRAHLVYDVKHDADTK
jgi:hypothetical protein